MRIKPPRPNQHDHRRNHSRPGNLLHALWRPAKPVANIKNHQHRHITPKRIPPNPIPRPRSPRINPHAREQHRNLHHHRPCNRVPQPQPKLRPARIQRHIRPMRNPVQHPVANHPNPDRRRPGPIPLPQKISRAQNRRPHHQHHQTVRPRIVVQIQRRISRVPHRNPRMLPPHQQKHCPQYVRQQRCRHQRPKRRPRRIPLRPISHRKMPNKHSPPLLTLGWPTLCGVGKGWVLSSPSRFYLRILPLNSVIPSEAARLFLPRRTMAHRAAKSRDRGNQRPSQETRWNQAYPHSAMYRWPYKRAFCAPPAAISQR